ncbi:hypothetical protein [Naasia sp. SYSU D00057]|uniref:hypothetical protein n=1 Tax=Naasia sp. SYSU D00057 TaxID=2817380 RepID=UPI001B31057A|nr:hypothetical protein [Naasia sp. SYSU D00057]
MAARPAVATAWSAAGVALAGLFRIAQLVRHPRPIHSRGALFDASLTWVGGADSGIDWVDQPAGTRQTGVGRVSRSVGLPPALPDILGLAVRVETPEGPADLELSTSGVGVPGRFALMPHLRAEGGWFGTLLPYRGRHGNVMLGARVRLSASAVPTSPDERSAGAVGPWLFDLYSAPLTGRWRRFATLELTATTDADDTTGLRFDAVRRPLPGAGFAAWHRRVREPSYRAVQGR